MHPEEYKKCLEGSGKAAQQELEAVEQGAGQPPAPPPHSRAPPSRYLRTKAAAAYLKLSTSTLAKMRLRGDGPPYSKAGPKIVVYDIADLDAYLADRRRRSTSESVDVDG